MADGFEVIGPNKLLLVVLDVKLPGGDGLDATPHVLKAQSEPEVIIVTGAGDVSGASRPSEVVHGITSKNRLP